MGRDQDKSKAELISELQNLRIRFSESLAKSEAKWRHILINSPQIGISLDTKGRVIFANDHFLSLTGWSGDEVMGRDWFETFIPKAIREEVRSIFNTVMAQKHDYGFSNYENEILHQSGEALTVSWTNVLTLDDQGYPVNVTSMGVDVTERRRSAEALALSEERLTLAVDGTGIGLWDWRISTGKVHFNEKWAEIVGYTLDELAPLDIGVWNALCHPEDLERSAALLQEHFEGKSKFYECEARMRHKQGHWIWVLDRGKVFDRDADGKPLRMAGTHQDITERKQAEQALRDSEERFKALHNASFGGITIHDKGIILDCNQGLCTITGFTMDELIGTDGLLLIAEQSREMVMANILAGYEKPYEAFGVRKNGEVYPLRLEARNIPYKGKQVRVVEFRDITDRKKVEKEQIHLKSRLEALWHVSSMVEASYQELCDMVLKEIQEITGSKYSFFGFINEDESAMDIHSWSQDAMVDCQVGDSPLHFPLDRAGIWAKPVAERREVFVDDYATTGEAKRGLPSGHVPIHSLLSVPILKHGKVIALAAVANKSSRYTEDDALQIRAFVTSVLILLDNRVVEEELKASEERLNLAMDTVNEGVWDWRVGTEGAYFNSPWFTMLGYGPNELPQEFETWRKLLHPDDLLDAEKNVFQAVEQGASFDIEFRMLAKSGEWRWINSRGRVVEQDSSGKSLRLLGTHMDITDRKVSEQELHQAMEELTLARDAAETANQAKSEFLATMSHEIRTPLNGIMGMLQLISTTNMNAEQQEYLLYAERSSKNLLRILSDILDISRVESGTMDIAHEPLTLNDIVEPVLGAFEQSIREQGLDLSVVISEAAKGWFLGDAGRIRQILYNLIGNAQKFTETGSIRLEVYPAGNPDSDPLHLNFVVTDTGVGIEEDQLQEVFKLFTQVDSSYRRKYGGTGLGLAIVKKLVDLMGGNILMLSEKGEGTEVHVTIPLDRNAEPPLITPPAVPVASGRTMTSRSPLHILVAEDDRVNQHSIRKMLHKHGFECECVENGRVVLRALSKSKFDLILMDIQMPELDGVETTKLIRQDCSGQFDTAVPIIALTAHAMKGDREEFLAAGMDDYLSKPIEFEALLAKIEKLLGTIP